MKAIFTSQIILTLIGGLGLSIATEPQCATSYFVGSMMILLILSLLWVGYGLIFQKKLIALGVGIIVFKYAILGIIIYTIIKLSWFRPLWFCLGVGSLTLSAIYFALSEALGKDKDNVI